MRKLWIRFVAALPLGDVTVLITGGVAATRRGKLRSGLLSELTEVASNAGISDGCIHARSVGPSGDRLSFYGVPEKFHQRLRNVWAANCR